MSLEDTIARHERIVLQFSGGKDSLALLHLCEPWWDRIAVAWCNPGDEFPETYAVVERVRRLPIHFFEVRPSLSQPESVALHGWPSDLVPTKNERHRTFMTGVRAPYGVRTQDWLSCCNRLLFQPLQTFVREYEATLVLRGQRADEPMVAPARDGLVVDGVEYCLPLQDWTEAEVFGFLRERGVEVPEHYQYVAHSLDCQTCTGFLDQSLDKLAYIRARHPETWADVAERIELIHAAVSHEKQHLDAALALVAAPAP